MKRFFAIVISALLFCSITACADAADNALQTADAAWKEGSFARALALYQNAKQHGAKREDLNYRIAVALGKTQKWDAAIAAGQSLLQKNPNDARVLYWMGRFYADANLPHEGYRVGSKVFRGDDYPKIKSAEKPQYVSLYESDQKRTTEYFERAKISRRGLRRDEENKLNFDLAAWIVPREMPRFIRALQKKYDSKFKLLKDETLPSFDENLSPGQSYNSRWSAPKKAIYLYNEIASLDNSKTKHDTALSLLAKGLFVQSYRRSMDAWAKHYDEKSKTWSTRAYPFNHLQAKTFWRQVVTQFPRDPIAPQTQLLLAQSYEQYPHRNLPRALSEYKFLAQKFPTSKWANDAKAQIQSITKRELHLDTMGAQPPGKNAKITITTRNLKRVEFSAYRVDLAKVLASQKNLADPKTSFTDFTRNFGSIAAAQKLFGPRVASWNFAPRDKGNHEGVNETVSTPLKSLGAYAIVAQAGNQLQFAQILLISDLAILKKVDRDNSFVYVADARSGAPVKGASVVLKEYFWSNDKMRASILRGPSDASGFFDKKLHNKGNTQVAAFARVGNRYAMTGQYAEFAGGPYYSYYENETARRDQSKIYSLTDRPVYRPGQKVFFRQIVLRSARGGDFKPLKNMRAHVSISDARGETVLNKVFTTSEFGTINGQIVLKDDAPLGEYSVNCWIENFGDATDQGGNRFRVEEYKRPEFKVQVLAPEKTARVGETVSARLSALYYFGAPVPNAKVKYTIRRSSWFSDHRFPRPFDWLWTFWNEGDYSTGRRNIGGEDSGEIIKQGEAKTDAQGNAEVSFKADDFPQRTQDEYSDFYNPLYTVEAEVTDASRRTIEAQGQVKVARQEYFAFLDSKQGFYQLGDRVPIEVATQDANDNRVAASGKMVVYKLLPNDKEERVFEETISTDKDAPFFWNWQAKQSGSFRIAYEAVDNWNQKIRASVFLWVAGKDLDTTAFRLQGVTIVLQKRIYTEGETAKVLLVGDKTNDTILLTQEAGGQVLQRRLVKLDGKSKEIEIPISKMHVPNFALAAATVRDYEVFSNQQEIFVPPAKQMLNVEVTSDKAEYKPGETGTFHIKASDWKGVPARAEISLALFDSSLFYIQKNYAPDIRTFFYGQRRAVSTALDSSRSGKSEGRYEDLKKYAQYESRGWTLPAGMGLLELSPGEVGYYGNEYAPGSGGGANYLFTDGAVRFAGRPMNAPDAVMAAPMATAGAAPMQREYARRGAVQSSEKRIALSLNGNANALQTVSESTLAAARIRENFSETAFWSPAVVTQNGEAEVKVTFPDSLTSWHANARGLSTSAQVGAGENETETKKDLIVRMQAPRFFVERDQVVLSANVHNYLKDDQKIKVMLDASTALQLRDDSQAAQWITVKAGDETRVNWTVDVVKDGSAEVSMSAQSDQDADAVKMKFPVLVHGVQKFSSQSGVLRDGQNSARVKINLPALRERGASTLNVQLNPSLAATMLDALPYLADYPYGCVEQTLDRFVPTAVAERTLRESGVSLDDLRKRAAAYAAEAQAKPIGERVKNSGYTYPAGMPNSRNLQEMASQLWFEGRSNNPIYDASKMAKMAREGLQRLQIMQRADGGWGWWQDSEESDPYMSALVVAGLREAQSAGDNVSTSMLARGQSYLEKQIADEDELPLLCQIGYSLSLSTRVSARAKKIIIEKVFARRDKLNPYSQSLLALALWNINEKAKAGVLVRNLENTALVDAQNQTARWKQNNNWWYWWNNNVETVSWALRAFTRVDPHNKLTPMIAKWLVVNARGNHWNSTKETAAVVYALADYVRVFKELDVDYTLTVRLGDKIERTYHVTRDNALFFDNRFIVNDFLLQDGANELTIEKRGRGNVYWSAASEYFSREEPITASGNEIAIKRRYFKLIRNHRTTEPEYSRAEIKDNDVLKSGDLIEVELTLDSKNDYEYLVFEDMKAAGLEPVDIRSGAAWGDGLCSNVELRDEKVALFVDHLPQGTRVLRYRVRAEIPGRFHALPTNGYAMYAPEVRAISDEMRIGIKD